MSSSTSRTANEANRSVMRRSVITFGHQANRLMSTNVLDTFNCKSPAISKAVGVAQARIHKAFSKSLLLGKALASSESKLLHARVALRPPVLKNAVLRRRRPRKQIVTTLRTLPCLAQCVTQPTKALPPVQVVRKEAQTHAHVIAATFKPPQDPRHVKARFHNSQMLKSSQTQSRQQDKVVRLKRSDLDQLIHRQHIQGPLAIPRLPPPPHAPKIITKPRPPTYEKERESVALRLPTIPCTLLRGAVFTAYNLLAKERRLNAQDQHAMQVRLPLHSCCYATSSAEELCDNDEFAKIVEVAKAYLLQTTPRTPPQLETNIAPQAEIHKILTDEPKRAFFPIQALDGFVHTFRL